jgi:hypothetical protein
MILKETYGIQILGIILLFLILYGCINGKTSISAVNNDTTNTVPLIMQNHDCVSEVTCRDSLLEGYEYLEHFTDSVRISNIPFYLEVKTYYINDILSKEDSYNEITRRPIILKQELLFFKNDLVINHFEMPFIKVVKLNCRGDSVITTDVNLWKVCVLEGIHGDMYYVHGTGLCAGNKCPEFFGYYSMEGDILYEGYVKIFDKEYLEKIYKKYGITQTDINECKNRKRIDKFWNTN